MAFDRRQFRVLLAAAFREFGRDKLAAFFSFLFPLMFVVISGITSTSRPVPRLEIGIDDRAHTPRSMKLVELIAADPAVHARALGVAGGPSGFRTSELDGIVVIPEPGPGTTDAAAVQLVADRYRTAQLRGVVETARARLAAEVDGRPPAFAYRTNEQELKVNLFTMALPGLLALAILQLGLFGTATPLVIARQRGTLLQLCLTPVRRGYLLAAQIVLRMWVALAQIALILGIAILGFGVAPSLGVLAYAGVSLLGAAMLVALGYAIAGLVPAKESGLSLVTLLNFLLMFAGGIFFDPHGSPVWPLPLLLPVSYLADAGRQLIGGMPGMVPLWINIAAIVGFTVLASAVATRTFRFEGAR